MPKIVRDLTILFAFCGAFYLMVVFVRGDSTTPETTSNFSIDRLQGDRMIDSGDWQQAIKHFSRIVEKDKYNGLAQANLSLAEIEMLFQQDQQFKEKSKANAYTQAQIIEQQAALTAQANRCIELQKTLAQFEYYRGIASRNLAQLYCFLGNEEEAIKHAERYVRHGWLLGGPLASDRRMKTIWQRPEFKRLLRIEQSYLPYF